MGVTELAAEDPRRRGHAMTDNCLELVTDDLHPLFGYDDADEDGDQYPVHVSVIIAHFGQFSCESTRGY